MLIDKIDSILRYKGKNLNQFAKDNNIKQANLSQKGKRNSFYLKEAIQIAKFTNTRLSFIDNETNKELISFDEQDIKESDN